MARYHITVIRPLGYPHSSCFHEVAEGLYWGLAELGHTVTFAENRVETEATTIILGAQLMAQESVELLPPHTVVYNLEQLGVTFTPPWYMGLAARVQIWDYTPLQVEQWRALPCLVPPRLVDIGYDPHLRRIVSATEQDIDVLFYGCGTPRRQRVLERLVADGIRLQTCFGVYGAERDALIARSKVVLNLHAAEPRIFERVRVSYLLANAKAVVTEESDDLGSLGEAMAVSGYAELVETCKRLVRDERERKALEMHGFRVFEGRTQAKILEGVVGRA